MEHSVAVIRAMLILITILIGVIVGLLAGGLARMSGSPLPVAIQRGGVAFGGTVSLVLLIINGIGLL